MWFYFGLYYDFVGSIERLKRIQRVLKTWLVMSILTITVVVYLACLMQEPGLNNLVLIRTPYIVPI